MIALLSAKDSAYVHEASKRGVFAYIVQQPAPAAPATGDAFRAASLVSRSLRERPVRGFGATLSVAAPQRTALRTAARGIANRPREKGHPQHSGLEQYLADHNASVGDEASSREARW